MAFKEILGEKVKWWQAMIFMVGTILALYGKNLLEHHRELISINAKKQANIEVIQAKKEADSLTAVLDGLRRAKEAEHAVNAIVETEAIVDRLAIDVQALRAHVVKLHNHVALEDGEIPDMSVYAEGKYDFDTRDIREDWRKQVPPIGFIKHFSYMLPSEGESYISPYNRYRYVPDVSKDSAALAGQVSSGVLYEYDTKSVLTFWITTTPKGEIFFLTVSYDFINPLEKHPDLIIKSREATRRIARRLTDI